MPNANRYMHSKELYDRALALIPGGVNSPVRAFRGVGGTPIFIKSANGPYIYDEDGNSYIDYVGAWGPMIIGHAHPKINNALKAQIDLGIAYGAPTALEVTLAEKICSLMPSIELVRLVNSGTEATMSAIRVARGFTGREKVIKFEGCYHGHVDSLLVKAGSGALTFGHPDSAGIPSATAAQTFILPYNNELALSLMFEKYGHEIACVIVEPVAGNMNCVPPAPGFLEKLRNITKHYGSLLIFDEVMTGFRVALGGAQSIYDIKPDLTTLGKVIGGGLPIGAFGGRKDVMSMLAPIGPVYQAGTLSGNPLAVTAGLVMLEEISKPDFYFNLTKQTKKLLVGLKARADAANIPFSFTQVGGMFGCYFTTEKDIQTYEQVMNSDVAVFQRYYHLMLDNGVYFAPSAYEAGFMSAAHGDEEIEKTLNAAEASFDLLHS